MENTLKYMVILIVQMRPNLQHIQNDITKSIFNFLIPKKIITIYIHCRW